MKALRSSPFQIRSANQGQVQNTQLYRSSGVSSWVAPHRRVPKLEYIDSVTLRWPRQDHKDELVFFADPAYPRAHRFDFHAQSSLCLLRRDFVRHDRRCNYPRCMLRRHCHPFFWLKRSSRRGSIRRSSGLKRLPEAKLDHSYRETGEWDSSGARTCACFLKLSRIGCGTATNSLSWPIPELQFSEFDNPRQSPFAPAELRPRAPSKETLKGAELLIPTLVIKEDGKLWWTVPCGLHSPPTPRYRWNRCTESDGLDRFSRSKRRDPNFCVYCADSTVLILEVQQDFVVRPGRKGCFQPHCQHLWK